MASHLPNSEPQISARLLQPFVKLLATNPRVPASQLSHLRDLSLDERIPLSHSYQLLAGAIALTNDEDLGLKAGRLFDRGAGGALEHAIRSADTVQACLEVASRFMRLLNDALEVHLTVDAERAFVWMDNKVPTPRAATDFQASALHSTYLKPHLGEMPGLVWSFPHPAPSDLREYEATFPSATLRFETKYLGYSFDKEYLTAPRETGDPRLHSVLLQYAERRLSKLPKVKGLSVRVRAIIAQDLQTSRPNAVAVASRLGVSQRTLCRQLGAEGTSFKELLDDSRRALALDYVARPMCRIGEVANRLGFSETATFYRAFKRWTGQTPLRYRRSKQGSASRDASRANPIG